MIRNGLKITLIIALMLAGFSSCNIFEGGSTSNTVLFVTNITDEGQMVPIFSNVASVANTLAEATLVAQPIDPDLDINDTSYYYTVIVEQIDVEYSRSDGLSQEGKDIPFAFSQSVHKTVEIGESVTLPFSIIQHVAKQEPPLLDLLGYNVDINIPDSWTEEKVLKLEAKVTFHGTDLGGHRIEPVVATVSVFCGNFGTDVDQ